MIHIIVIILTCSLYINEEDLKLLPVEIVDNGFNYHELVVQYHVCLKRLSQSNVTLYYIQNN